MSTVAGDAYWIVACSTVEQPRESIYSVLRSRVHKNGLVSDTAVLEIPMNLKFGSFDDLIRMADDLVKHDATCEQIVRRLERQGLEIDPSADLRIYYQRSSMTFHQYLQRFSWDDAKYPKARHMKDNIDVLLTSLARIDDEVRIKASAFYDIKQSHAQASKEDRTSLVQRDLMDVLTPQKVADNDFVETEHLTTVIAVVPAASEKLWLNNYQKFAPNVIPESTKKFDVHDKDNNGLWKVVLFKSSLQAYKDAAKAKSITIREFKYNPVALEQKREQRSALETERNKQESFMSRVCAASFSDACISWVHIKAMRVFVEATLRFGVPPNFATFLIKPYSNKEKKLRVELNDIFTTKGMFGRAFIEGDHKSSAAVDTSQASGATGRVEIIEEEYYPYVSFSIIPFALYTQK